MDPGYHFFPYLSEEAEAANDNRQSSPRAHPAVDSLGCLPQKLRTLAITCPFPFFSLFVFALLLLC